MFNISLNIRQNVSELSPDLTNVFRRAMTWATEFIRRKATLNAPYLSWTLRRSITTSIGMDWKTGYVGSNQPYARRREFENNKNPDRKYYMRNARNDSGEEVEKIFIKEVENHFSK